MDELITRHAAADLLRMAIIDGWEPEYAEDKLKALPTVKPKRGNWVKISPANIYECSKCGKHVMTNDISAYDFCHGCGADMKGGDNGKT